MSTILASLSRRLFVRPGPPPPLALYRSVTIDVYRGKRKKMAPKKAKKVIAPESPVISNQELLASSDDPVIINPDNYLIKVPDRKITAKHVEDIVSGIVSRYLAGSEGSTASHWASFPLSPLEVKFSIVEASSRECMISLSSWEITKVQTAGQLAEAIIKKYLHNESLHADVDSVEKYFMDNDAPPNLYHIHQKRLSTARSPDASELVQPNG